MGVKMFNGLKNKVKSVFKKDGNKKKSDCAVEEIKINEAGEITEEVYGADDATVLNTVKKTVETVIDKAQSGAKKVTDSEVIKSAGNAVEIAAATVADTLENVGDMISSTGKKVVQSEPVNKILGGIKKAGNSIGNFVQGDNDKKSDDKISRVEEMEIGEILNEPIDDEKNNS